MATHCMDGLGWPISCTGDICKNYLRRVPSQDIQRRIRLVETVPDIIVSSCRDTLSITVQYSPLSNFSNNIPLPTQDQHVFILIFIRQRFQDCMRLDNLGWFELRKSTWISWEGEKGRKDGPTEISRVWFKILQRSASDLPPPFVTFN